MLSLLVCLSKEVLRARNFDSNLSAPLGEPSFLVKADKAGPNQHKSMASA